MTDGVSIVLLLKEVNPCFAPTLTTSCNMSDDCLQEKCKKPSITARVLNGDFGSVTRDCLRMFQKGGFVDRPVECPHGAGRGLCKVGAVVCLQVVPGPILPLATPPPRFRAAASLNQPFVACAASRNSRRSAVWVWFQLVAARTTVC